MKQYRSNKGLKKRCQCARRTWETCLHPWYFNFMWKGRHERGCLDVATREEAIKKFTEIKSSIMNGTYTTVTADPAPVAVPERPTFAMVADQYAKDAEGLAK